MNIRPQPINQSSYPVLVGNSLNSSNLRAGSGIKITHNSQGNYISAIEDNRKDNLTYRGLYDYSQEYFVNDLVYVDPNQEYLDETGSVIPFIYVSGSNQSPISGGVFVCSLYVPPITATSDLFLSVTDLIPSASSDMANSYRWLDDNYYYPIYPTIPTSSQAIDNSSGYNILANQTYWDPVSPMIVANLCVDGNTQIAYINGVMSGSIFSSSWLPYTG